MGKVHPQRNILRNLPLCVAERERTSVKFPPSGTIWAHHAWHARKKFYVRLRDDNSRRAGFRARARRRILNLSLGALLSREIDTE